MYYVRTYRNVTASSLPNNLLNLLLTLTAACIKLMCKLLSHLFEGKISDTLSSHLLFANFDASSWVDTSLKEEKQMQFTCRGKHLTGEVADCLIRLTTNYVLIINSSNYCQTITWAVIYFVVKNDNDNNFHTSKLRKWTPRVDNLTARQ